MLATFSEDGVRYRGGRPLKLAPDDQDGSGSNNGAPNNVTLSLKTPAGTRNGKFIKVGGVLLLFVCFVPLCFLLSQRELFKSLFFFS